LLVTTLPNDESPPFCAGAGANPPAPIVTDTFPDKTVLGDVISGELGEDVA
jgi:hypothetical protein